MNSYLSMDISRIEQPSIYNVLSVNHTMEVYDPDYLRHIAVRCIWKLDELAKNPSYDCPKKGEAILHLVISQLTLARSLMNGDSNLDIPFSNKMQFGGGFYKEE